MCRATMPGMLLHTSINHLTDGCYLSVIREMGSSSTVLLKNKNGALPLNKPKSLALIGSAASVNPSGANAYECWLKV
jgi:hypothetical protein